MVVIAGDITERAMLLEAENRQLHALVAELHDANAKLVVLLDKSERRCHEHVDDVLRCRACKAEIRE